MSAGEKLNLFSYQSYRLFLKDWYEQAKKTRRGFSYRAFAQRAGFQTSNFMQLVMKGKRNLTEQSLIKMMKGLGLNKQEQEFFRNLVFFGQAKSHEEKNRYYQRLLQSKKYSQLKPIEKRQYEYYSTWYHPVIRELVASKGFDGTPEWLSKRLNPQVTTVQCGKSIELLESLGFIKKVGESSFQQTSSVVSTGPELTSLVVHNYHKKILELTHHVMDSLSMRERDVSTLTLGVKKERIPEFKKRLREFRKELLELASTDDEPEEVVQLNLQFFPVTVKVTEE
jgi:uncharacterized protein (TIGR02147 family)